MTFAVGDARLQNVEIIRSLNALSLPSRASLQLTNCKFYDNQYAVYSVNTGGQLNISTSSFERNQYAVYIRAGQVNISTCSFERNRRALWMRDASAVVVEDSHFTHNTYTIYVSVSNSLLIKRSKFVANKLQITTGSYGNGNESAAIEDCLFNSSELVIYEYSYYRSRTSSIVVANSTFESSDVSVSLLGTAADLNMSIIECSFRRWVHHYQAVVYLSWQSLHSLTLAGNVFEENHGAPCIKIYVPEVSSYITPGLITMVGNNFSNHSGANVIVIDGNGYYHMQLRRNVFQNPMVQFEIEVQLVWRSGYTINASENWWGSTNRTYIAERVKDVFFDSTKAKVSIASIYSDPEMTQLEVFPDLRTWNVADGTLIGGELDRNVTLTSSNSSYFVNKTIYIPREFQLQLQENVTLHFAEQRGIIVEGTYALYTGCD